MTIQQLKLFLAVEKYMNFSVAAAESDISQSSLSKQIKALENELYVTLFDRSTRKISITPAGMRLAIHAKRITEEYEKLITEMRDYSIKKRNTIRIASISIMNQYRLTEMIASFKAENPEIDVDMVEKDADYVVKSLEKGETDVAILRAGLLPSHHNKE